MIPPKCPIGHNSDPKFRQYIRRTFNRPQLALLFCLPGHLRHKLATAIEVLLYSEFVSESSDIYWPTLFDRQLYGVPRITQYGLLKRLIVIRCLNWIKTKRNFQYSLHHSPFNGRLKSHTFPRRSWGNPIRLLVNFIISEFYGFSSWCTFHKHAFHPTHPLRPPLCMSAFSP